MLRLARAAAAVEPLLAGGSHLPLLVRCVGKIAEEPQEGRHEHHAQQQVREVALHRRRLLAGQNARHAGAALEPQRGSLLRPTTGVRWQ